MSRPIILFEDECWSRFLPLVYLRGLFELRCGQGLLWERVVRLSDAEDDETDVLGYWCRPGLAELVAEQISGPVNQPLTSRSLLLCGRGFWRSLPEYDDGERSWVGTIGESEDIACIAADDELARSLTPDVMLSASRLKDTIGHLPRRDVSGHVHLFAWPWELVNANSDAIVQDCELLQSRSEFMSAADDLPGVHLLNRDAIHIGTGTRINPCVVIDAEHGPVWIGERVTIQPHVFIEGPAVIGDDCLVQPGGVIRHGTSLGPRCKVGGEVEASILQGFTNKQHDGFLGHSYLGSWVNIGADCLNSDLKNTYGSIRVPINGREVDTGEQFVGLLMGDHSKTGINVAFPTGAVVGLCSNVVCPLSPKFVPSFAWIDAEGRRPFDIDRGMEVARRMMSRRGREISAAAQAAFRSSALLADQMEDRGELRS